MPISPRARATAAAAVSVIAILAVAAPASAEQRNVSMVDDRFAPVTVTVRVGDRVRWENDGRKPHTVTSRTGLFDSGLVTSGRAYTRTFSKAGTYRYHCFLHAGMDGTVVVRAVAQPKPTSRPVKPRPNPRPAPRGGEPPDTAVIAIDAASGSGRDDGGGGTPAPALLVVLGVGALGVTFLGQRRVRVSGNARRRR